MNKELKPVRGGCGGEAIIYINGARQAKIYCEKCGIESNVFATKYEAITAWNRAMGERYELKRGDRTAKVDRDAIFPVNVCGICHSTVDYPDKYCSECGAKLDWSNDE